MALVLTLHNDDFVSIGPDITLKVYKIKAGQMKLSIEAPRDVRIERLGNSSDLSGVPKQKEPKKRN